MIFSAAGDICAGNPYLKQMSWLEWLQASYDKRKNRSFELGVKAIDALIKEGKSVSYRTVSDKSKAIDPEGIGIHQNTIRKNQELHNHFLKHIKEDRDIDDSVICS